VLSQDPLAFEIESGAFRGPEVSTSEQAVEFAHSPRMTIYHAVGSDAIGPTMMASSACRTAAENSD
jgi:hypothetical protein